MNNRTKEWLQNHYRFGFECATQGWRWEQIPRSTNHPEVNAALEAGFKHAQETVAAYEKVAKEAAEKWVEKYQGEQDAQR